MYLHDYMTNQRSLYESRITALEQALAPYDGERLMCSRANGKPRWYLKPASKSRDHRSAKNGYIYLRKADSQLLGRALKRKLQRCFLADWRKELKSIDLFLNHDSSDDSHVHRFYRDYPEAVQYLEPRTHVNAISAPWFDPALPPHPDALSYTVKAANGLMVRSKSEALIIHILLEHGIEFRYECPIRVGGNIYYPDFLIVHPKTGKYIIWEHLGMMESESYARRNDRKIADYRNIGFYPFKNLILTYEYTDVPFDITQVEEIVQRYLLG